MPIQAPQWTEFLSCPVCYNVFNEKLHRPISLACGHTVCKACLSKLQQRKCPFDQSSISRDIDDLPVNYALLQLVGATIPEKDNSFVPEVQHKFYTTSKKCIEELALLLRPVSAGSCSAAQSKDTSSACVLSRPMQRKLITLINCQLIEEEGRLRAMRAARSLGERTVTELILQHQNTQQLSASLWTAVRGRGCQFLGPAMQEEVLKLILLALEDNAALSRKVLVLFVVQRLEPQYPQASKTAIGHVVQLLYRASCFKVTKREEESSLMQLKDEFCNYEALRREHDTQIVQIAMEAGLRIAPDQWSSLLYGDTTHKSHMQSIIDKLQTPQTFASSISELIIVLQRSGDPYSLQRLRPHLEFLASIDASPEVPVPSWENLEGIMKAVKTVVKGLVEFLKNVATKKLDYQAPVNMRYKTSMCRDYTEKGSCPRGGSCTFAHSEEELERYRQKNKRVSRSPAGGLGGSDSVPDQGSLSILVTGQDSASTPQEPISVLTKGFSGMNFGNRSSSSGIRVIANVAAVAPTTYPSAPQVTMVTTVAAQSGLVTQVTQSAQSEPHVSIEHSHTCPAVQGNVPRMMTPLDANNMMAGYQYPNPQMTGGRFPVPMGMMYGQFPFQGMPYMPYYPQGFMPYGNARMPLNPYAEPWHPGCPHLPPTPQPHPQQPLQTAPQQTMMSSMMNIAGPEGDMCSHCRHHRMMGASQSQGAVGGQFLPGQGGNMQGHSAAQGQITPGQAAPQGQTLTSGQAMHHSQGQVIHQAQGQVIPQGQGQIVPQGNSPHGQMMNSGQTMVQGQMMMQPMPGNHLNQLQQLAYGQLQSGQTLSQGQSQGQVGQMQYQMLQTQEMTPPSTGSQLNPQAPVFGQRQSANHEMGQGQDAGQTSQFSMQLQQQDQGVTPQQQHSVVATQPTQPQLVPAGSYQLTEIQKQPLSNLHERRINLLAQLQNSPSLLNSSDVRPRQQPSASNDMAVMAPQMTPATHSRVQMPLPTPEMTPRSQVEVIQSRVVNEVPKRVLERLEANLPQRSLAEVLGGRIVERRVSNALAASSAADALYTSRITSALPTSIRNADSPLSTLDKLLATSGIHDITSLYPQTYQDNSFSASSPTSRMAETTLTNSTSYSWSTASDDLETDVLSPYTQVPKDFEPRTSWHPLTSASAFEWKTESGLEIASFVESSSMVGNRHKGQQGQAVYNSLVNSSSITETCLDEEEEEDFLPFDPPIVSKFGPISRAARAKFKSTGPVQVTADEMMKKTTPVTALTPGNRPIPNAQTVPSRFDSAVINTESTGGAMSSVPNVGDPNQIYSMWNQENIHSLVEREVARLEQQAQAAPTENERIACELQAIEMQISLRQNQLSGTSQAQKEASEYFRKQQQNEEKNHSNAFH